MKLAAMVLFVGACAGTDPAKDGDTDDTDGVTDSDTGPVIPPPPLEKGVPMAGAAESTLKLPVGTPLAGFTARCGCLGGGLFEVDDRDSNYSKAFIESTGVHVRPTIKAIWIDNGDDTLVMTKTDSIYSFDGLVKAVELRLEELTGEELTGKVTHSANHNHSSYGTFSKHTGLFLGHDMFNQENFTRMVEQVAQVAFEAYQNRRPAKLGFGNTLDWDPEGHVYSDRRSINNPRGPDHPLGEYPGLLMFDDLGPEQTGKDPNLHVLRIDYAEADEAAGIEVDDPMALLFSFGMHPYVFGEGTQLATGDATVLIEEEVSESFDKPMVAMFVQGSAGDASVRGDDKQRGWARMEAVGVYARDAILALRDATPTSGAEITIETATKSIGLAREDIRVTRNGTVDWYFPELTVSNEEYIPDGEVFDENGDLISPLDEFHTNLGAVFCGSGDFDLPIGGFNTDEPPYGTCMQIEFMLNLLKVFFDLDDELITPPIDGLASTLTAGSMLGGIPVLRADGTTVEASNVLLGFVPGEPVHLYSELWRHRVRDEFDVQDTMLIGYSMDHYGYLLPMEDWVLGEYEADITFWGPIGAEHVLENLLYSIVGPELMTTDLNERPDPKRDVWEYREWPFENRVPDTTEANEVKMLSQGDIGTCDPKDASDPTRGCYDVGNGDGLRVWVPEGFSMDLDLPSTITRLTPVQVAWIGGDPGVDNPRITIEREVSEGVWEQTKSHSGKPISEDHHDFGLAHTPDPLFPASADQTHTWWATWQAVGHIHDRAGFPTGTYRMKVQGKRFPGGDTDFPWDVEDYVLTTASFEVVEAVLTTDGTNDGVVVSIDAPAKNAFRLVDIEGSPFGANPLRGELNVTWYGTGDPVSETMDAGAPVGGKTLVPFPVGDQPTGAVIVDQYGNTGTWGSIPIQ